MVRNLDEFIRREQSLTVVTYQEEGTPMSVLQLLHGSAFAARRRRRWSDHDGTARRQPSNVS